MGLGPESSAPHVGIFWLVPGDGEGRILIIDSAQVADGEAYGDVVDHPRGHYDVWEEWRCLGSAGRRTRGLPGAIAWAEYEAFPRGRVVYSTAENAFWIYADRRLQTPSLIAEIRRRLRLLDRTCIVKSDSHYR